MKNWTVHSPNKYAFHAAYINMSSPNFYIIRIELQKLNKSRSNTDTNKCVIAEMWNKASKTKHSGSKDNICDLYWGGARFDYRMEHQLFWSCLWFSTNHQDTFVRVPKNLEARGSVVGWGTMLQAGRSRIRVPMRCFIFNFLNPSSRTMALALTQPLTEMSTRNLPGG
jgi:hypothetical protein